MVADSPPLVKLQNPSRSLRDLRVDHPSKVICKGDGTTHTLQKTAFKKDLETSLIQYIGQLILSYNFSLETKQITTTMI